MSFSKEERRLIHKKAQQPLMGNGVPSNLDGKENDIAYRRIPNKGIVHYVKRDGEWQALSSTDSLPTERSVTKTTTTTSGGTSSSVTDHGSMSGLTHDDHAQYLLIDGTRAMTGGLSISGDAALNFTAAGENSIRIPDNQASALIIEESGNAYLTFVTTDSGEKITLGKKLEAGSVEIEGTAFDINGGTVDAITSLTVANNVDIGSYDLRAATLTADGLTSGRVLFATTNGQLTDDSDFTFSTDTLTVTKIGAFEASGAIDFSDENMTNVNIDSGAIDAVTLGTNSAVTEAQIDNVNINGGTINATSGDLTITAAGGDISFGDDNIATTGNVDFDGNLDVDGTTNLDNTDIDGTFAVDGTTISLDATTSLNIDNSNTSNGITIGTATSGMPISIGHTVSETTVNDNLSVTGILDITNTTQATNNSGDTGALRCEGGASIAKKGYFGSTVTIGASGGGAGADLIVHGDTNGTHMTWDESGEILEIVGRNGNDALWVDVGDVHIDEVLDLDGSVDADVTDFDVASSGDIDLVSTNNAVGAITIHANGGTSETILIRSDQGTAATEGAASVQLLSDVGGINIKSGLNNANAILLTADGGTSETIVLHSDQGTGAASIALVSDVGGVTVDAGLDIELNADGGNIFFKDGSQQALNIDMDDTAGDAVFKDAGDTEIFRIDGSENSVRFTGYGLTNSDPYSVSIKPLNSTQHMTMGLADKQNNYSMIGMYSAAAASISGVSIDDEFEEYWS